MTGKRPSNSRRRRTLHLDDFPKWTWPGPGEPIDGATALQAIIQGNAKVLARYLLKTYPTEKPIKHIAFLLDPNLPDAPGGYKERCWPWRLKFEHVGRGNRRNALETLLIKDIIGDYIDNLIKNGEKAEAAKQNASEKFGISLRQANKALSKSRTLRKNQN